MQVLVYLANHANRTITRDEIIREVWRGALVTDDVISQAVYQVRRALGDSSKAPQVLETLPRLGYRWIASVSPLQTNDSQASDLALDGAQPAETPSAAVTANSQLAARGARRTRLGVGLLAVVAAAVGALLWFRSPQDANKPVLPLDSRSWLLVADVDNQSGDPRFDTALSSALAVSLEQSSAFSVFPRARSATTLEYMRVAPGTRIDEVIAREICERENIRALLVPTLTRTGTQFALAARLVDPVSGRTLRPYMQRAASESDLLGAIQNLARSVRRDIGEPTDELSRRDRPLAAVTTSSIEALRVYSEGREL